MLPLVLRQLEALQADLAAIDPTHETDAADRVASMAVALRDMLAGAFAATGGEAGEPARVAAVAG